MLFASLKGVTTDGNAILCHHAHGRVIRTSAPGPNENCRPGPEMSDVGSRLDLRPTRHAEGQLSFRRRKLDCPSHTAFGAPR
jgi:hypothetical protein